MSKFPVNYESLDTQIGRKTHKLSDVKDRIEKVAFDVVRFKDGEPEKLWQIHSADDGDYIVSLYDEELQKKEASSWSVVLGKTAADVHLFYKGEPVVRLAAAKLGVPESDLGLVKTYLPAKLASNKKLVSSLLKEVDTAVRDQLVRKYPELA